MKVYHIERDFSKSLKEQKKELAATYSGFQYLFSDGHKIHFIAN